MEFEKLYSEKEMLQSFCHFDRAVLVQKMPDNQLEEGDVICFDKLNGVVVNDSTGRVIATRDYTKNIEGIYKKVTSYYLFKKDGKTSPASLLLFLEKIMDLEPEETFFVRSVYGNRLEILNIVNQTFNKEKFYEFFSIAFTHKESIKIETINSISIEVIYDRFYDQFLFPYHTNKKLLAGKLIKLYN